MEIKKVLLTPSKYNRPQTKIKPTALAWHYVGNPNTSAMANRNYFESLKSGKKNSKGNYIYASSHFIIGLEGEILQLIPENEKSFCTNQANSYTISIECCHPDSTGKFTEATYNSMVWLGKYLMKKHNIKNNIRHYDVTKKCCPKWFVDNPSEWTKFKNRLIKTESEEEIMFDELIKEGYTKDQIKNALIQMIKATESGESTSMQEYVDYCKKNGIMNGYTDGTFKPNKFVSRAELSVVATKLHKQIK